MLRVSFWCLELCVFWFDCLLYAPWAQSIRGARRPHPSSCYYLKMALQQFCLRKIHFTAVELPFLPLHRCCCRVIIHICSFKRAPCSDDCNTCSSKSGLVAAISSDNWWLIGSCVYFMSRVIVFAVCTGNIISRIRSSGCSRGGLLWLSGDGIDWF